MKRPMISVHRDSRWCSVEQNAPNYDMKQETDLLLATGGGPQLLGLAHSDWSHNKRIPQGRKTVHWRKLSNHRWGAKIHANTQKKNIVDRSESFSLERRPLVQMPPPVLVRQTLQFFRRIHSFDLRRSLHSCLIGHIT